MDGSEEIEADIALATSEIEKKEKELQQVRQVLMQRQEQLTQAQNQKSKLEQVGWRVVVVIVQVGKFGLSSYSTLPLPICHSPVFLVGDDGSRSKVPPRPCHLFVWLTLKGG